MLTFYLSTRKHSRPTQETKKRVISILNERNASNIVKSHILFMLDCDLPAPDQPQTNTSLDQMINAIENDELLDYSYMPSHNDELVRDSFWFFRFSGACEKFRGKRKTT